MPKNNNILCMLEQGFDIWKMLIIPLKQAYQIFSD